MATDTKNRITVEIPTSIGVRELAERLEVGPVELLKALISNGVMVGITEAVDFDTAAIVAEDFGVSVRLEGSAPAVDDTQEETVVETDLDHVPWYLRGEPDELHVPRPPIVTVMGHVDHGKTTLLDAIRDTRVVDSESGGITQHVGAYTVHRDDGSITFIDTPGHEAFTAMRARGAQVTDIAIIVVAADDGLMPQTMEAINHARAANVPIIVAMSKMDLPNAHPDRLMDQLSKQDLMPDAWGGDTFVVPVSGTERTGIDELLDAILLVAEAAAPKTNPNRSALGTVIEGSIDQQRGVIAAVLVLSGKLHRGDVIVVDGQFGKVRAMFDESGERIDEAGPSMPVEIMGLSEVPDAGARFEVVANEKAAKVLVTDRGDTYQAAVAPDSSPMTLDELFARTSSGEAKSLNLIVKTDVQGTLEPVVEALERMSGEVRVQILHAAAGDISERDINLAAASDAVVIGFRVGPDGPARRAAAAQRVELRQYEVIYKLIEDIQDALTGMLEPVYEDVETGAAEVRQVFSIGRSGNIAGCAITRGVARRNASARVMRSGEEVAVTSVSSLKRFTEDAREVREGFECGVGLAGFDDFEEGDEIVFFVRERSR